MIRFMINKMKTSKTKAHGAVWCAVKSIWDMTRKTCVKKRMFREAVLLVLLGSITASCIFTGCSNNNTVSNENNPTVDNTGASEANGSGKSDTADKPGKGWALSENWSVENSFMPLLTQDEEAVFEKAADNLTDASYEPVFVIGGQVVAGMNYAYLCHRKPIALDPEPSWVVVVVYQNLRGDAEVTAINDFDPTDIFTVDPKTEEYELVGGWSCPTDDIDPRALSDEAYEAYRGATTNTDSSMYFEPIVLLATQNVSDQYYRLLCRGTYYGNEPPVANIYVVDIRKNQSGKSSICSYKRIDVSAYVTAG